MKLLLDECIDRRLAKEFSDRQIKTVPQMGWAGTKNGRLLTLAEQEFDVFITVDRNLLFEQNLSLYNIAVVVLQVRSNRLTDLQPLVPKILAILPNVVKGQAVVVS